MKYLDISDKPKVYEDMQIYPLYKRKEGCIGTVKGDSFIKVKDGTAYDILILLKLMDGNRNIDDIKKIIKDSKIKIDIEVFIDKCAEAGLFENINIKKKTEIARLVKNIFTVKLDNKQGIFKFFKFFPEICFGIAVYLFIYFIYVSKMDEFSWMNLITADIKITNFFIYYLGMVMFMFIHEFFHLCVMQRYGLSELEFNIGLHYYIFPVFYVKGKGMYALSKWKRINILLAGVAANFCLMIILLWVHLLTKEKIYIELSFFNLQSILINLMPFALRDGYFILANSLNKINLRDKYHITITEFPKNRLLKKYDTIEKMYVIISFVSMVLFCFYQARNMFVFIGINTKYTPWGAVLLMLISILFTKVKYKSVT